MTLAIQTISPGQNLPHYHMETHRIAPKGGQKEEKRNSKALAWNMGSMGTGVTFGLFKGWAVERELVSIRI